MPHTLIYIYMIFFFYRNRACASLWKIKHALLSCTQGFVPTTHCPTTTAMFHHEQTHRKSFHAPIVCSIHLPWLERKLCSLGVWSNQMQQGLEPALLFCQKTLLAQWVMETWISPSPEVKNTHFTTEPDCVVTFQSLVIFMKQHCTSEAFLVLVFGLHFSTSHIVQYCQKILLKKNSKCCKWYLASLWSVTQFYFSHHVYIMFAKLYVGKYSILVAIRLDGSHLCGSNTLLIWNWIWKQVKVQIAFLLTTVCMDQSNDCNNSVWVHVCASVL